MVVEEVAVKELLIYARADRACRRTAREGKWYMMVVCKKVLHATDGGGDPAQLLNDFASSFSYLGGRVGAHATFRLRCYLE
jgi:hypothetical protein